MIERGPAPGEAGAPATAAAAAQGAPAPATARATTLLHITDLHFGPPALAEAVEAIHAAAEEHAPDAIACSGDLVQRGDFVRQFEAARAFLDRFAVPLVCVPGNHDIPFWNPLARATRPFERYRRYIAEELDPILSLRGAVLCGICTPRIWTIDLGYVSQAQLERVRAAFDAAPPGAARIVVMHHPLQKTRGPYALVRDHVRGSRRAIRSLRAAGAHLVLCGHTHVPLMWRVEVGGGAAAARTEPGGTLMVQGGTACSSRFRPSAGCAENTINLIRMRPGEIRIETLHLRGGRFRALDAPRILHTERLSGPVGH